MTTATNIDMILFKAFSQAHIKFMWLVIVKFSLSSVQCSIFTPNDWDIKRYLDAGTAEGNALVWSWAVLAMYIRIWQLMCYRTCSRPRPFSASLCSAYQQFGSAVSAKSRQRWIDPGEHILWQKVHCYDFDSCLFSAYLPDAKCFILSLWLYFAFKGLKINQLANRGLGCGRRRIPADSSMGLRRRSRCLRKCGIFFFQSCNNAQCVRIVDLWRKGAKIIQLNGNILYRQLSGHDT